MKSDICFSWQRGVCRRGDGCRLRHSRDGVSDSAGGLLGNMSYKGYGEVRKHLHGGYGRCNEETMSSESSEMGTKNRIESCWELQYCKNLLSEIMKDPNAKAFLEPVDWEGLNIPNYPDIIKRPMDLLTVRSKLEKSFYSNYPL